MIQFSLRRFLVIACLVSVVAGALAVQHHHRRQRELGRSSFTDLREACYHLDSQIGHHLNQIEANSAPSGPVWSGGIIGSGAGGFDRPDSHFDLDFLYQSDSRSRQFALQLAGRRATSGTKHFLCLTYPSHDLDARVAKWMGANLKRRFKVNVELRAIESSSQPQLTRFRYWR